MNSVALRLQTKEQKLQLFAWAISVAVTAIAIVAWGQAFKWQLSSISSYLFFPVLGLLAFSLMWTHYIASALRQYVKIESKVLRLYFRITSAVVLACILLHPGILVYQLWRDGQGLPPGSYLGYVAPTLKWAVILGSISLLIFLAYEFKRKYGKQPWWKYMEYATDTAMIGIFIHSLKLGGNLQMGWFKGVWYFYGVSLAAAFVYIYYKRLNVKSS